jgi:hypothetical protein
MLELLYIINSYDNLDKIIHNIFGVFRIVSMCVRTRKL